MNIKIITVLGCAALMSAASLADTPKTAACTCACACKCQKPVDKGIEKAVGYYIEGGRKGDSKITSKAFAQWATMSWSNNGKLTTVPIQALYEYVDKSGAQTVTHGDIKVCAKTDTTAVVSVDTQFGDAKYTDMFSLVRNGDEWKIVAKIYHVK